MSAKSFFSAKTGLLLACLAVFFCPGFLFLPAVSKEPRSLTGAVTDMPLPRFVSLKADKVNVRRGPGLSHQVIWVYQRKGLPVEIIAEFERWRRIRDKGGEPGWIYYSLLDSRRSVLVESDTDKPIPLYQKPDASSPVIATMEAGVIGRLEGCENSWCRFSVNGYSGWAERNKLWGVYPDENIPAP